MSLMQGRSDGSACNYSSLEMTEKVDSYHHASHAYISTFKEEKVHTKTLKTKADKSMAEIMNHKKTTI